MACPWCGCAGGVGARYLGGRGGPGVREGSLSFLKVTLGVVVLVYFGRFGGHGASVAVVGGAGLSAVGVVVPAVFGGFGGYGALLAGGAGVGAVAPRRRNAEVTGPAIS